MSKKQEIVVRVLVNRLHSDYAVVGIRPCECSTRYKVVKLVNRMSPRVGSIFSEEEVSILMKEPDIDVIICLGEPNG